MVFRKQNLGGGLLLRTDQGRPGGIDATVVHLVSGEVAEALTYGARGAQGGDGFVHALGAEDGGAGYQGIGAAGYGEGGGFGVDAAVNFDAEAQAVIGAEAGGGFDFRKDLGHEFLAAEAGLDGHEEEEIDLAQKRQCAGEGGAGAQGETGGETGGANAGQGGGHIVIRFQVDGDAAGVFGEAGEEMVRTGDHEVNIQGAGGALARGGNEGGTKGDIIDEVAVHDVHVQPIGAGVLRAADFLGQARKIAGEDGGGDDERVWTYGKDGKNWGARS